MTLSDSSTGAASTTFADLQIHPSVLRAVADVGYESPTGIQAATIPALMAGSDVVGLAQTGTGKTAAFAIPILSKIDVTSTATQALVLAPTRELALQVAEAFSRYGAHLPKINVLPIYGGSSYSVQLAGLRRGAHVVVGTPGRVIDHLERGTLDLSHVDYLVLDEADEMLTMGFAEEVDRILSETRNTSRWHCSPRRCRPRSASSPPSTCTTRSRSAPRRKPRPPRTSRSATSRSPVPARWTR